MNEPRALLICYVSVSIGLGHLSRLLALAQALRKEGKVQPEFLIFGDSIARDELDDFITHIFPLSDNFRTSVEKVIEVNNFETIVLDLYPKHDINNLGELFMRLKEYNISLVSIDSLIEYCNVLDLVWVPSFNFDCSKYSDCISELKSGWDSFLIQKRLSTKEWIPGFRVLILTGGGDVKNLGRTLPTQLDELLRENTELHWVRGPFSEPPTLPNKCRLKWIIHDAPSQLDELIVQSNYVMTVFGISFFEVLQYGIPSVVFSPYDKKDDQELIALAGENVAMVADNSKVAVNNLIKIMDNNKIAKEYSINALKKMSISGTQKLLEKIYLLTESY
jgi:spore coat polysaccharide biosynthesis predicted glycosyltransferase SpsG